MTTAVPWLPPPGAGEAEAAVARFISAWLAEWVVQPIALRASRIADDQGVIASADAQDSIALAVSACAGQADTANASDARVLQTVGEAMIADLDQRLGSRVGPDRRFRIEAVDGRWRVDIAVDEAFLVRQRRAAAGSAKRPAVVPLADALAGEDARLGCHLGAATLTAADIAALARGDVIVLDRKIDASVPLTVEHRFPRAGQARVEAEARTVKITLTEPLDLLRKN